MKVQGLASLGMASEQALQNAEPNLDLLAHVGGAECFEQPRPAYMVKPQDSW